MNNTTYPRHRGHFYSGIFAVLAGVLFFAASAFAQTDPPGRIGRIAWLAGSVSLQNAGSDEKQSAALNQPLTSGDVLRTEAGSRVEIQIGSKTIRLDSNSVLDLDRIDDELVRVYLDDGRAIVKLPTPEATADFEMATMNGQFNARNAGIYRFGADVNGSIAAAYSGRLHFEGERLALDIGAGENAQFWTDGQTRSRLLPLPNDEFSQWSSLRDRRPAENAYARYVSPEMTGATDLDNYGDWSETPEYGAVWYPRALTADWAPYRTGNWVWVAPWGWSWVGYEPWGFAPFHYGRWVQHRGRWGWVPGTRIARPVYAPAMVAWVGSPGHGVGIAIGGRPTVGWFPLAPHEVYVPSYRSSANYLRQVNVSHVSRLSEAARIVNDPQAFVARTHYAHRELPQAVTVVPSDVVTQRRSVAPAALAPGDRRALREQPLQAAAPLASPAAPPGRSERAFNRRENDRRESFTATPGGSENRGASAPSPAVQAHAGGVPSIGERREPAAPPASVIASPRNEPVRPEIVRPIPAPGVERLEPRAQERPFRREEMAPPQFAPQAEPRQAQREVRVEPPAQLHQAPIARPAPPPQAAPEVRREAPREIRAEPPSAQLHQAPVARPALPPQAAPQVHREAPREFHAPAARVEAARPQADAERQRSGGKEDRRHRDENEKH